MAASLVLGCEPRVEVISEPGATAPAGSRYAALVQQTPGLVAYFRMTEAGGNQLVDRVAGIRLEAQGTAPVDGPIPDDPEPSALELGPGVDPALSGAPSAELAGLDELSLEVWLAPADHDALAGCAGTPHERRVVWLDGLEAPRFALWSLSQREGDPSALELTVQVDPDGSGDELRALTASTVSGVLSVPSEVPCSPGNWHHVVASYARRGAELGLRIYVNGVLTPANGESHPFVDLPATQPSGGLGGYAEGGRLRIAEAVPEPTADDRPPPSSAYVGALDELAVYSRALTPGEIAEHYAAGLEGGRSGQ